MSKVCGNCGTVLPDEARFCVKCGTFVERQVQPSEEEAAAVQVSEEVQTAEEPQVTEEAPAEQEEDKPAAEVSEKAKKEKKGGHRVLRGMLTALLCIVLFVIGLTASVTFSVRRITSESSLTEMVMEADFTEIKTGFLTGNGRKETLPEMLYNESTHLQQQFYSVRDLERLVNRDFVKEFVAEQLSQYMDDIFRNRGEGIIETEEVEEFLLDNSEAINKTLGVDWSDTAYRYLAEFVESSGMEKASDLSEIKEQFGGIFLAVRILFSYPVIILMAVIMILLIWAILAVNKASNGAFYAVSVSFFVLAMLPLAMAVFGFFGASALDKAVALGTDFYKAVLHPVRNQGLILGGAFVAVGLIMITVAAIKTKIKKVKEKKAAKEAA